MINLCYVINVAKNQGPCNVIYNLASTLSVEKYKIHLVTLYRGNEEAVISKFNHLGISVKEMNYKNRVSCMFQVKEDLQKYCKSNQIDIIHSHTFFSDFSVSMVRNVIKMTTVHNRPFEDYKYLYGSFLGNIIARLHIYILRKFDKCICCSKSVYNEQKKYLGNITAVQNGIRPDTVTKIVKKRILGINDDSYIFIYVGSISKRKNVANMIRLFVNHHRENDYLLIIGEGSEVEECKKNADEHVKFLGFIEEPYNYYDMADVYISASLSEGLSLSQLEAMSFGLKQLVSNIPSHREVIDIDEDLGCTFNIENFDEAFYKVTRSLDVGSKEKIKKIFFDNFSAENMANKYDNIYSMFKEK